MRLQQQQEEVLRRLERAEEQAARERAKREEACASHRQDMQGQAEALLAQRSRHEREVAAAEAERAAREAAEEERRRRDAAEAERRALEQSASEAAVKAHGLTPLARIHHISVTGGDPIIMLEEPLFATEKALKRAGMKIDEIDLYEVNEAFAPVPLAWLKHNGADPERINVNGGAIALGHPLGASGTKLMATLVHALRARGKRYGLQTMCEGGGLANVTIVEAL